MEQDSTLTQAKLRSWKNFRLINGGKWHTGRSAFALVSWLTLQLAEMYIFPENHIPRNIWDAKAPRKKAGTTAGLSNEAVGDRNARELSNSDLAIRKSQSFAGARITVDEYVLSGLVNDLRHLHLKYFTVIR